MNCLFAKNIKRQPSAFFLLPSADAHDADDVESSGKQQGLVCIHNQNNICIFLTVYILKLKASEVYVCMCTLGVGTLALIPLILILSVAINFHWSTFNMRTRQSEYCEGVTIVTCSHGYK